MYKETPIGQIIHMRLQIACSSHDFRIFEKWMNFEQIVIFTIKMKITY
jgi:hypothetical protein